MDDWSAGYVADVGYTFGYYQELNPLRVKLAFRSARLACPDFAVACELGFGQGMSVNIHAAASCVQWHGTDFNPSQAAFAQELARASGAPVKLRGDAFADFCMRSDLPEFDYIGLHGIWSWISDANRAVIVDFVRRKLKVGGVLYISYNTLPGWASFAPMRHLMTQHADVIGAEGEGIVNRINAALEFSEKLLATQPLYSRANPGIGERLKKIKEQNRNYVAHEYFNRDWLPMHFADMARWLAPAKLGYACSAHYIDHVDGANLSADQQGLLQNIPDPQFRESARDFMVNQQFRRDYWVKGARRLSGLEQTEALRAQRVVLTSPRAGIPLQFAGSAGEAKMSEAIYGPVMDALADHKVTTIGQLEQTLQGKGINLAQLLEIAMVLTGAGHLSVAQEDSQAGQVGKQCYALNAYLMDKSRSSADLGFLASPLTGGGVSVGRLSQLFLLARRGGAKQPADWAQIAWQVLSGQGHRVIREGKALESARDNLAELVSLAMRFEQEQLPLLKALQVC
jgi:SAM-dependent methyltransferase